jgi:hypothetical protein
VPPRSTRAAVLAADGDEMADDSGEEVGVANPETISFPGAGADESGSPTPWRGGALINPPVDGPAIGKQNNHYRQVDLP